VVEDEVEGFAVIAGFEGLEERSLLGEAQTGELAAVLAAGERVERGDGGAVLLLVFFEFEGELAVDVVDDAGGAGAGVLVSRDEALGPGVDGAGFVRGEEAEGGAGLRGAGAARGARGGGREEVSAFQSRTSCSP
jgi:hypothetical protein